MLQTSAIRTCSPMRKLNLPVRMQLKRYLHYFDLLRICRATNCATCSFKSKLRYLRYVVDLLNNKLWWICCTAGFGVQQVDNVAKKVESGLTGYCAICCEFPLWIFSGFVINAKLCNSLQNSLICVS